MLSHLTLRQRRSQKTLSSSRPRQHAHPPRPLARPPRRRPPPAPLHLRWHHPPPHRRHRRPPQRLRRRPCPPHPRPPRRTGRQIAALCQRASRPSPPPNPSTPSPPPTTRTSSPSARSPSRHLDRTGASQILVNVTLTSRASRPQPASAPAPVEELLQQVTDAGRLWPQSNRNSPDSIPRKPRSAPAPLIIPITQIT